MYRLKAVFKNLPWKEKLKQVLHTVPVLVTYTLYVCDIDTPCICSHVRRYIQILHTAYTHTHTHVLKGQESLLTYLFFHLNNTTFSVTVLLKAHLFVQQILIDASMFWARGWRTLSVKVETQ